MTGAKAASRARPPWTDELNRLRLLEQQMTALADDWETRAVALEQTITGASDYCARELLDRRAQELRDAAGEMRVMITRSYADGPPPGAGDWLEWHLAEALRLAREHLEGRS